DGSSTAERLKPVLEDVGVDAVARSAPVVRPDVALLELDEIERLLGQAVAAVRARLGIPERRVDALDAARLPLQVAGCTVMPLVRARRDPHPLARPVPHRSSSPGASTPFSVRIVSTEKSQ